MEQRCRQRHCRRRFKNWGYEVYNIDYQPRPINDKFDYRISAVAKKAAQVIKGHLNPYYSTAKKTALYDAYLDKNLNITEPCNTEPELENLNRRMDAFVCGSDQIWSPSGFDPKYFLSFVRNPSKMVAYAPSIGLMNIKHPYVQERMRFLINRVGYGNTVIAIDVYPVHVSIGRKNCC